MNNFFNRERRLAILALPFLTTFYTTAIAQASLQSRMEQFLTTLDARDPELGRFFHPQRQILFRSFNVATGELLRTSKYTQSQIITQLKRPKSFAHHHFFDDPNGHTFRADWSSRAKLRLSQDGSFRSQYAPDTFKTYIRWAEYQGSWFIVELGESMS